jgi:hypothetical protein
VCAMNNNVMLSGDGFCGVVCGDLLRNSLCCVLYR